MADREQLKKDLQEMLQRIERRETEADKAFEDDMNLVSLITNSNSKEEFDQKVKEAGFLSGLHFSFYISCIVSAYNKSQEENQNPVPVMSDIIKMLRDKFSYMFFILSNDQKKDIIQTTLKEEILDWFHQNTKITQESRMRDYCYRHMKR